MATISLFASKINQMPELLKASKKKVTAFQDELQNLNKKILNIDNSACDVYNEAGIVRASVNTQEVLADSIGKFNDNLDEFISDTVETDNNAAALIRQNKKDFYEKYSYLKPECEKSTWEKVKGGFKKAGQWCKDHWKIIVTVVLVIAAIVVICVCPAAGLGLLAIGAAKGLIAGAVIGGIIGGISTKATGKGSFLDGFEDGAFSGAITGAIFGGIGGAGELAGQALGRSCDLIAKFGPAIKNVTLSANILNLGMAGFDLVSLGAMMIDPKCKLVQLNQMLHSSKLYNGVQLGLGAVGAFGAGMLKGIQFDLQNGISKCFVAGTMISTVSGLTAIENIRAGDIVLSADEKTGERGFKKVVETYVRETMKLVHLIVNGEEIVTTEGHPFYVRELGFVVASELSEGDVLTDSDGNEMPIESVRTEITASPVTVYNFQVEEYHTYFVSDTGILVHNADHMYGGKVINDAFFDDPSNIGTKETWNAYISDNPKGNYAEYLDIIKTESPWPPGYKPQVMELKHGQKLYMAIEGADDPFTKMGGWASDTRIPDIDFVRNNLAVKLGWKNDPSVVKVIEVKPGVSLKVEYGPVGPQIDLANNIYHPGDMSVTQYKLFANLSRGDDLANYLDYVSHYTIK